METHGKSSEIYGNLWKSHDFDGELYGVTTKDGGLFWTIVFLIPGWKMLVDKEVRQNTRTNNPGGAWVKGDGEKRYQIDFCLCRSNAEFNLNS